jgi:hypothetical protein
MTLAALRGQVVRVVFGPGVPSSLPPDAPAATILLPPRDASASEGGCIARDPAVARAYAIVAGLPDRPPAGTAILIDANGWLRAVVTPADEGDLAAEIKRLAREPLPPGAGGMESMHHH